MSYPAPGTSATQPHRGERPPFNVLAIVGFVLSFVVGVAGLVCGIIALTQIHRTQERGRGLAIAAVVIGGVTVLSWALAAATINIAIPEPLHLG